MLLYSLKSKSSSASIFQNFKTQLFSPNTFIHSYSIENRSFIYTFTRENKYFENRVGVDNIRPIVLE